MKFLHHSALVVLFILAAMLSLESWGANFEPAREAGNTSAALLISASVGPQHYLSGAKVVVMDARGRLIGRATTNIRGVSLVNIAPENLAERPFRIKVTGGRILDSYNNGIKGPRFHGTLRAQINAVETGQGTPVYLDLISTAASRLESGKLDYPSAFDKVRDAFGISSRVSPGVFRYQNNFVGWAQIESHIKRKQGFNPLVRSLVKKIKQGDDLKSLQPNTVLVNRMANVVVSSSGYSPCESTVGNSSGNGGTSSTELISLVGVAASKSLLSMAGMAYLSPGVDMVAGMLFTGGNSTAPIEEALKQVSLQLECISAQINYLTQQVALLLQYTTVAPAMACDAAISTGYTNYAMYVDLAQPNADGTPSNYPLNDSNPTFKASLDSWDDDIYACGTTINNMLWGTKGGQGSAWQTINSNSQNSYPWWTQGQVQELQEFLAYWSMRMHEVFVLNTEYLNYYQAFSYVESRAGAYQYSEDYCNHNTSYPNTFCVWQNNILAAYPGDLYSDELAMPRTGLAVHVIPGAKEQPVSGSAWPLVDTTYLFQYPAKAPEQPGAAYPYDDIVTQYWSAPIIAPNSWLGSAVQTFTSYPKAPYFPAYKSEVDILNQNGPRGPWSANDSSTAADFFRYQVNQSPISPWTGIGGEWLSFYTRDNVSVRTSDDVTSYPYFPTYYDWYMALNSSVANKPKYKVGKDCRYGSPFLCAAYGANYYIGIIQKRTWWQGSVGAATFQPPCPPLPQGQQC